MFDITTLHNAFTDHCPRLHWFWTVVFQWMTGYADHSAHGSAQTECLDQIFETKAN